MLSVIVHKDISEFRPKIIGQLTLRQLLFLTGAIAVSLTIGVITWFVFKINNTAVDMLLMAAALPFWALGYYRPQGMDFEKFCKLWYLHNCKNRLLIYQSTPHRLLKQTRTKQMPTQDYKRISNLPAIESIDPTEFFDTNKEVTCLKNN